MLYTRKTKTRVAGAKAISWSVDHFTADKKQPALAIKAICDDGKQRNFIFYGEEISQLTNAITLKTK